VGKSLRRFGERLKSTVTAMQSVPDSIFQGQESRTARGLRQNLQELLEHSSLTPEESGLALLAIATGVEHDALVHYARERLAALRVSLERMQQAAESAAVMGMLNVYYSFREVLRKDEEYGPPRLRGQVESDMLGFALSVLNGCEPCIVGHEQALRDAGVGVEKIHDLAKLAAVVKGLKTLSAIA